MQEGRGGKLDDEKVPTRRFWILANELQKLSTSSEARLPVNGGASPACFLGGA